MKIPAVSTRALIMVAGLVAALPADPADLEPDEAIDCEWCEAWNEPREPFRVFGNTYYVGTAGLSSVLITSDDGHVLVDGALPQSAPLVASSIRTLGFRPEDVRIIVNSHAHYDHAGGIAALQRATGAGVAASAASAVALERGNLMPGDPQFGLGPGETAFPPVQVSQTIRDGEVIPVGDIELTAHLTPGHTPGGTSWSWQSCEGDRCMDVVYADSLTAVSAPGFSFRDSGAGERLRASIQAIASLPCDILLVTHPNNIDLAGRYRRMQSEPGSNPFIDADACARYARKALGALDRRLEEEGLRNADGS